MRLEKGQVEQLSTLSRLTNSPRDIEPLINRLNRIIEFLDQIAVVDASSFGSVEDCRVQAVLRDDVAWTGPTRTDAWKDASDSDRGYVKVSGVIKK